MVPVVLWAVSPLLPSSLLTIQLFSQNADCSRALPHGLVCHSNLEAQSEIPKLARHCLSWLLLGGGTALCWNTLRGLLWYLAASFPIPLRVCPLLWTLEHLADRSNPCPLTCFGIIEMTILWLITLPSLGSEVIIYFLYIMWWDLSISSHFTGCYMKAFCTEWILGSLQEC